MSCPPDPATFRLLDALVGWEPDAIEGIVGAGDLAGLTLARTTDVLTSASISAAIPPRFLARACDPCRWYLVTCCPPRSRLLVLDSCASGWRPVHDDRCAPDLLQCADAIAVREDRIAISDPGAGRIWVWRRGGEQLAYAIPFVQPGPLAWTPHNVLLATDRATLRLRRFDAGGAELPGAAALPGTPDRIAVDHRHVVWLVTRDNARYRLWRLEPGAESFTPARLADLEAAFPDTAIRDASEHHFCLRDEVDGTPRLRCFDCHGRPGKARPGKAAQVFARRGQLLTLAIDSGIPRCRWHRVRLDAEIPAGTGIEIAVSSHEDPTPPAQASALIATGDWAGFAGGRPNPEDWTKPAADPRDFMIDQPPGRFLFVRIRMTGDGFATPRLRRMRIDMPRQTSFDRLPAVYADNPVAIDFGERFLALFDAAVEDMDRVIERYPGLLDTAGVPAELLPWIGSFLGLTMDSAWSSDQRRAVIAALPGLFRRSGTPAGVKAALALILGSEPVIVEPALARPWGATDSARIGQVRLFGRAAARLKLGSSGLGSAPVWSLGNPELDPFAAQAFRFEVMLPLAPAPALRRQVGQIIESQKPAHTVASVRYGAGGLVIGMGTAVGIDSALVALPPPTLGGADGARLGRRTVLWSRHRHAGPPVQIGSASAVGIHTIVE
ncbi:MAG: phage tail protein [Novosphingobium sp.]